VIDVTASTGRVLCCVTGVCTCCIIQSLACHGCLVCYCFLILCSKCQQLGDTQWVLYLRCLQTSQSCHTCFSWAMVTLAPVICPPNVSLTEGPICWVWHGSLASVVEHGTTLLMSTVSRRSGSVSGKFSQLLLVI
jgi:hypothetical protein